MPQRVYVAASFEQIDDVKALYKKLRAAGHVVTADWTIHKEIASMSSEKERQALKSQYVIEDTEGVTSASVYALLLGPRKSTGAHIEFGIALGAKVPLIVLIGRPDENQLFYCHPSITIVPNVKAFMQLIDKGRS
jgi:hypothetical protein